MANLRKAWRGTLSALAERSREAVECLRLDRVAEVT